MVLDITPESSVGDKSNITELNTPILGTFTGVFAKLDSMSVNGRYYSAEFWKKVLSSKVIKEDLALGHMFGTIEHPSIRTDFTKEGNFSAKSIINSSHVTKELSIDSEGDIIGKAYIFNNKLGRLLASYLLAKDPKGVPLVQLHVSARGFSRKDYFDSKGIDHMNPDDYHLEGFDVVVNPGIKGTRIKFESDGTDYLISKLESQTIKTNCTIVESQLIINNLRDELNLKYI
jgi:hypothetical protein